MDSIGKRLEQIVSKENVKYNEPMYKHTTFKTGGKAEYCIKADSIEKIKEILKLAQEEQIPLYIIGNGSNLVVKDEGKKGIVLKIDIKNIDIEKDKKNVIVTVGAGVKMMGLAQILKKNGISGFEELSGIPRNYRWSKQNECRFI